MRLTNKTIDGLSPRSEPFEVRDDDLKGFLARVQPTGRITYYFDFRDEAGNRQRIRIGTHGTIAPASARETAVKHAAEVALGRNVQAAKKESKTLRERAKHNTLKTFIQERYQPWVEIERKSGKATVKRLNAYFEQLMNRQLSEIDLWSIEKWRSDRKKAGIKPSTINRDVTALKAMLSKAVEWNVIEHHPLQRLKPLRFDNKAKVRFLSKDEEFNLRMALKTRQNNLIKGRVKGNVWRANRNYKLYPELTEKTYIDHLEPMILVSINTGMRRGELFQLKWSDINEERGIATIEGSGSKSGKTRHLPLNSEVKSVLKLWRMQHDFSSDLIFPNSKGSRFNNVNTAWKSVLKTAEIREFRWHDMRHHFASRLVMAAVDLNTVRELLGHSDLSMTLRYAHLAPEHKARAVEMLIGAA